MKSNKVAIMLAFGVINAFYAPNVFAQVKYDVTPLNFADESRDNQMQVFAINQTGNTAGYSGFNSDEQYYNFDAVWWDVDGGIHILSEADNLPAEALGLNDVGVFVGVNRERRATVWMDGQEIEIGNFDSNQTGECRSVNNSNEAVGSDNTNFGAAGFYWTIEDGMIELMGINPSDSISANAINEESEIVGAVVHDQGGEAAVWSHYDATPVLLGTLGDYPSSAFDINDLGQIVGWSSKPGSNQDQGALLWQNGTMQELPQKPGTFKAVAIAINNRGQIVGSNSGPVLWQKSVLIDLREYAPQNVTLYSVYDINDRGQICGDALIDGEEFQRGVLLTPRLTVFAPEPGVTGTVNTITIDGGTPDQRVVLIAGLQTGSTNIPGCPGLSVGIDAPRLLGTTIINSFGLAEFAQYVPGYASGRTVHLAAVEPVTCRVSETMTYTFP